MAEEARPEPPIHESERLERLARSRLRPEVFDFFAGGSGEESTLAENVTAWASIRLRPRVLRDVSTVATSTTVLGTAVPAPILVAPMGYQRLVHEDGELAMARGCAAASALMIVSTRSSTALDQVRHACGAEAPWLQVYLLRDREQTAALVTTAREAGYRALVLTADTPVLGARSRDVQNGFVMPEELFMPGWEGAAGDVGARQDPAATFEDIAWLRELSGLPVVVKGVLRPDDAVACVDAGAAAVVVSNHGGRQLDGAIATAHALADVADAVGERAEVYVDGGVRTGVDVVRALALGARAVLVGRPFIWALATGGAEGVSALHARLEDELALALALAGVPSVGEVTRDLVTTV